MLDTLNSVCFAVLCCSQGWKWHSPACYWVGEDLLTFEDAKKSCESHQAALVPITNRFCQRSHPDPSSCYHKPVLSLTQAFFSRLQRFEQAFANSLVFGRSGESFWIGLYDQGSPGSFHWLSGDGVSYTNWNRNEPGSSQFKVMYII